MAGFRPEHLNVGWVAAGAASIAFAHALVGLGDWRFTVPYFLFTLVFYYGGNAAILSTSVRSRLVARFGEESAFHAYESVLGVMFLNQGLGIGCMASLPGWELAAPREAVVAAAAVLFAVGLVVKLWATLVVGTDTFYYFDMFVDRAVGTTTSKGPYRFLRNPMYGMGQLQGYGYALFAGSLAGLFAAAVGHALIFTFFFLLERPFMRRVYPAPNERRPLSALRPSDAGHLDNP
jgi:protein-S-isoprenylcysteine O-methyltransferase Ste14